MGGLGEPLLHTQGLLFSPRLPLECGVHPLSCKVGAVFFSTLGKTVGECSSLFACILYRRIIKGWSYQMQFPIRCAGLGALLIKRTDNTACYMMMIRVCCRMTNCSDNEGIRLHTSDGTKEYTTNTVIYNCKE
jgi:hypothetical protein